MPELDPRTDADITARLVEQLTRTNERLERLEAALRERSLLPAIQQEPAHGESDVSELSTAGHKPRTSNGFHPDGEPDVAHEAEEQFRRGVASCQAGNFPEAIAAWKEVLRLQPDNSYAMANIGIVYTEQGKWQEARDVFKRVLKLQPDNAEAYYGLGMSDAQLGDYSGAVAAWENTIRLQPDNADAHYNLTLVRKRLGELAVVNGAAPAPVAAAAAAPPSSLAEPVAEPEPAPLDDEEAESSEPVAVQPLVERDWKRIDPASERAPRPTPANRGAGRPTRPVGKEKPRTPIGAYAVGGAVLVGLVLYGGYRISKSLKGGAAAAGMRASHTETPVSGPATPASSGQQTQIAVPTVQPVLLGDPRMAAAAAPPHAGPAQPGVMQIRLGAGVTGQFRYWFVSRGDRAAAMRWLPRANRAGMIVLNIPAEYNQPGSQLRILNARQGRVARIPVLDVSRGTRVTSPNVGPNLLQNADFSQGPRGWSLETTAPGRGTMRIEDPLAAPPGVTGHAVHFDVAAVGKQGWNVQCYQSSINLTDRQPYLLSFWARSDRPRNMHVDLIVDQPDWHPVGSMTNIAVGSKWQKYLLTFTPTRTVPGHTRMSFILGETLGPVDIAAPSLRRSQGASRSAIVKPTSAITVNARDFN